MLAGSAALAAPQTAPSARPGDAVNIVLILVDDLGWSDLACYGSTFCETPNVDGLAREGLRFTDAYAAAPVCSPTRASIMTGQYPPRVGITDYLRADDELYLPADDRALPKALCSKGYACGLIGKWHLMGDYGKRQGDPARHGFDEVICSESTYIGGGDYFHPYSHLPGVETRLQDEYLTDRLNLEAVDFIGRHRDRPFFLYLSHYAVHTRLSAKADMVERYRAKPGAGERVNNPALAAMLQSIDEGVGMIASRLEELGIADRTVVMFTSDNGGEDRVTSNAPLRGGKSQLYEGGIRVPLVVRWPRVVKPGSVCRVPVTSADLYPTILNLAAATSAPNHVVDGESLVPLLRGARGLQRKAIFWHYPLDKPHFLGGRSSGAIRRGNWKLIEFYDTGGLELYNLKADPGEGDDLAARMPRRADALRRQLAAWRTDVNARMPAGDSA